MIPVLIQAGGQGTRLRPFTTVLPKPLMPIGDLPVIEIVLRQLKHYGFQKIHLSIGHLGHLLRAVIGDGKQWGLDVEYVPEDRPLGTIGPFRQLPRPQTPILVMNGDLLTSVNYAELVKYHMASDAQLTIGVCSLPVSVSLGVLDIDPSNRITGFREKPTFRYWASMGVYVLSPAIWDLIPPNQVFGFDTLMDRVLAGMIQAQVYRFEGIWLDIGRPEDYEEAFKVLDANRGKLLPDESA
jgi:NDP-sugar pyrophosphorylase family protein